MAEEAGIAATMWEMPVAVLAGGKTGEEGESVMQEVTFADFATAARKRDYTREDLTLFSRDWWEYCRDRYGVNSYDTPEKFAERVFSPKYGTVVIPYLSMLTLFENWHKPTATNKRGLREKFCLCGCGIQILSAFKKYASDACRKKASRTAKKLA